MKNSKWIDEIINEIDEHDFSAIMITLKRIDNLLRRAKASTDSETLLDSIEHELYDFDKPMMTSDNFGEFEDTPVKDNDGTNG